MTVQNLVAVTHNMCVLVGGPEKFGDAGDDGGVADP